MEPAKQGPPGTPRLVPLPQSFWHISPGFTSKNVHQMLPSTLKHWLKGEAGNQQLAHLCAGLGGRLDLVTLCWRLQRCQPWPQSSAQWHWQVVGSANTEWAAHTEDIPGPPHPPHCLWNSSTGKYPREVWGESMWGSQAQHPLAVLPSLHFFFVLSVRPPAPSDLHSDLPWSKTSRTKSKEINQRCTWSRSAPLGPVPGAAQTQEQEEGSARVKDEGTSSAGCGKTYARRKEGIGKEEPEESPQPQMQEGHIQSCCSNSWLIQEMVHLGAPWHPPAQAPSPWSWAKSRGWGC